MTRKYLTIPAVLAGALGITATNALASEPTTSELLDQIKQLQSKVSELENRQNTLTDAQIGATIDSVLKDAERRTQLMQLEGFTAGWNDGHFWLRSADGKYSISPRLQMQFRHVINFQENGNGDDDAIEKGFEIRRAKFGFVGTVCTEDLSYNFRWATKNGNSSDGSDGSVSLENAYVQYQMNDQWAIRGGQWKDNVFHEETVSSGMQLAAERSLMNEVLAGGWTDYVQGVAVIYNPKDAGFRGELAIHDGANTDNTSFFDDGGVADAGVPDPDQGAGARLEWAASGNFDGYSDFTARNNKSDVFVVGGGVNWTQAGDDNAYFHTVDVQWENTTGLGMYGALVGHYLDTGTGDEVYNWGALFQVGYAFNENWEVFGRVDWVDLDDSNVGSLGSDDSFHEYTFGVNYYFCDHNAKFTFDVGWLPDGSPVSVEGAGIFSGDGDEQIFTRAQFQLMI